MNYFLFLFIVLGLFSQNIVADNSTPSLRNKIGQMLLIGFDGKKINNQSDIVKIIEKDNIGGVILFDWNQQTNTFDKNIESPAQVTQLNHDLQHVTQQANLKYHRPNLPLLISVDYEGGEVSRLNERYGFPATLSATETGKKSLKEAKSHADHMAKILKNVGFNLDFAPVLDVNTNSDNPVIAKEKRSFSKNPTLVASYAEVYTRSFLNQKIQCAYKHFPGHGSSTGDSHVGFVDVSNTWNSDELLPYRYLLNKSTSCGMIMTAHTVNRQLDNSGLPATLSHKILTKILRQQLHFKGVIITDDMQMKAISDHYGLEHALVLAINAGADMFIFGNNLTKKIQDPEQVINIIEAKVQSGEISVKRINEAYQHIVALKKSISSP